MNPYALLAAGLLFAGIVAGSSWKAYELGQASIIASQAEAEKARQETRDLAMQSAASAIAAIEVKNVTVRQQLEREIVEKPVFRECAADDRVFDLVNEAITGTVSASSGIVP